MVPSPGFEYQPRFLFSWDSTGRFFYSQLRLRVVRVRGQKILWGQKVRNCCSFFYARTNLGGMKCQRLFYASRSRVKITLLENQLHPCIFRIFLNVYRKSKKFPCVMAPICIDVGNPEKFICAICLFVNNAEVAFLLPLDRRRRFARVASWNFRVKNAPRSVSRFRKCLFIFFTRSAAKIDGSSSIIQHTM